MSILHIFNNREIATIVWAIALLVWVLIKQPTFYKSILGLLGSVVRMWKYFLPMLVYVALSIFILHKLCLWDTSLMKVTIFWFFGWAVVMFVNSMKIGRENGYLKKIIFDMVGLAIFISFISNFYSFSLWFELLLVPFVGLLAGMSALAGFDKKYDLVGKFTNGTLIGIGLIVFIVSLYKTVVHFNDFATVGTLQEFTIPILLSLMFIPFAYAFSLYGRWEQERVRANFLKKKHDASKE